MFRKVISFIRVLFQLLRFIPHFIFLNLSSGRDILKADARYWEECYNPKPETIAPYRLLAGAGMGGVILWLLVNYEEFRSLFYYRIPRSRYLKFLAKPMPNLFIRCNKIGKGLFIQHGYSTGISAKSIGEYCWINQQVVIGYSNKTEAPVIGNNVKILAGAIVIGGISIGDNAVIGAGTTVVKDVPANMTVVGAANRYFKRKDEI